MKIRGSAYIALASLVAPLACFFWFAQAADQAMDKSGIGDLALNESYNRLAWTSFYAFAVVLFIVLAVALWRRGEIGRQLLAVCAFTSVGAVASYAFLLVA